MSAFSTTCTETFESPAARPSVLKNLFSSVMREIRLRRAMREVASLDEAMLQDIGLGPGSIEDAVRHGRC
jgi:uncharacterized protein YjiS (DUF1127 family)